MPGVHFGSYSVQSVVGVESDPKKRVALTEEFLRLYTDRVESRLGKPIKFSAAAQDAWEWLKYRDPSSPYIKSKYKNKQGYLNAAVSEIVGSIHDTVATERAAVLKGPADKAAQTALRKAFDAHERFFATADAALKARRKKAPKAWTFAYDGERVFAADDSGKVVAMTSTRMAKEWQVRLEPFSSVTEPRLLCPLKFARLTKK